jgi:Flp pilus assembly pilin Flp
MQKRQHKREENEAMKALIRRARRSGQSLVEYGLVLALIAIVAILVIKAVGTKTTSTFDNIQSQMTSQGVATTSPTAASS